MEIAIAHASLLLQGLAVVVYGLRVTLRHQIPGSWVLLLAFAIMFARRMTALWQLEASDHDQLTMLDAAILPSIISLLLLVGSLMIDAKLTAMEKETRTLQEIRRENERQLQEVRSRTQERHEV